MDLTQRQWQIDWKQVGDYLLGRSTLIGIASMMPLTISAYARQPGDHSYAVSAEAPVADGIAAVRKWAAWWQMPTCAARQTQELLVAQ
jgi:hypothetical protein